MKHTYSSRKKSASPKLKDPRECVVVDSDLYEALRRSLPVGWKLLVHPADGDWVDWPADQTEVVS
jgi:hypothetical protein